MNQALAELIDKVNTAGRAVLVVELAPPQPDENEAQRTARLAVFAVRSWSAPAPHAPFLAVTGQPLAANLLGVLERTRTGTTAAQTEFEQALQVLPLRRRQFSPDHRWSLYDVHPAQGY